jgi:hypothetical protein
LKHKKSGRPTLIINDSRKPVQYCTTSLNTAMRKAEVRAGQQCKKKSTAKRGLLAGYVP